MIKVLTVISGLTLALFLAPASASVVYTDAYSQVRGSKHLELERFDPKLGRLTSAILTLSAMAVYQTSPTCEGPTINIAIVRINVFDREFYDYDKTFDPYGNCSRFFADEAARASISGTYFLSRNEIAGHGGIPITFFLRGNEHREAYASIKYEYVPTPKVPLPAGLPLMGSIVAMLAGLASLRYRNKPRG